MVFKYEIEYGNFLDKFLGNVTEEDFIWHIDLKDDDVLTWNETDDYSVIGRKWLFNKEDYTAEEFINLIKVNNTYAISCNIQIYKNNGIKNIDKDKSFLDNDFEVKIIIIDNMFIQVYYNNEQIAEILKNNLNQLGAEEIDFKIMGNWYHDLLNDNK